MARGNFYEVSKNPDELGSMTEEDFYGSNEGSYFEDSKNSSMEIQTLFDVFHLHGMETGQGKDGRYYVVFTENGKESWFQSMFLKFKALADSMDLKTFSTTSMYQLKYAICDDWGDAVCVGSTLYPMDEFIREAECNEKYYFGNVVFAH